MRRELGGTDIDFLVAAVFNGLLRRDPDPVGAKFYADQLRDGSLSLRKFLRQVSSSLEFSNVQGLVRRAPEYPVGCSSTEAMAVFSQFERYQGRGRPGFITSFLGCLTDVRHVNLEAMSGAVESYPIPRNFHADVLEWVGTLRAVLEAKGRFTMIELGAGWAPWCAIGYRGARQKGLEAHVTAVEGDAGHVAFIREAFRENDIPDADASILYGVVGVEDGMASFPKSKDASVVYGGAAAFRGEPSIDAPFDVFLAHNADQVEAVDEVACFSLRTLLEKHRVVDLLHCDIQGAEADVFERHIETVTAKVRRVIVGTHGFELDRRLVSLFPRLGWVCEGVEHTTMAEHGGQSHTTSDGTQVWRNQRL